MTQPTSAQVSPQAGRARPVGIGRAHAKAVLVGEHAVVYGAAALAVPIPQLTVTATASWTSRAGDDPDGVSFTTTGSPSGPTVTQATESLARLAIECKAAMGVTGGSPHLDVIIDSAIPVGRGLGSSAASARAVVFAIADLLGRELTEIMAFDLVQTAENVTHGRSSGVDARAVGAAAPLLFHAGEIRELPIGCDGLLIIADSGAVGRTKDAVELLSAEFRRRSGAQEAFVRRAAELTDGARCALAGGRPDELGARLTEYHELLRAAGLSTPAIDALVDTALEAGGLGAKITGGGLGGSMLTLTKPERADRVVRRLHAAGAVRTWEVRLGGRACDAC